MQQIVPLSMFAITLCVTGQSSLSADKSKPAGKVAGAEVIRRCVEQLDSDRFAERRAAFTKLVGFGAKAIPLLEPAIQSTKAELSDRAIRVLQQMAEADDEDVEQAAVLALQRAIIKGKRNIALRAAAALEQQQTFKKKLSVATIKRLGGTVYISSSRTRKSVIVRIHERWDGGNRALRLLHRLGGVTWLSLERSSIDGAGLQYVGQLQRLQKLYLGESRLRDGRHLEHLQPLKELVYLSLRRLPLDDSALRAVGKLRNLESLGLDDTKISDEGLQHLSSLQKLRILWLNRTSITDRGVVHLAQLTQLRRLYLAETKVAGPGLSALQGLEYLNYLSLKNVRFKPGDLKAVGKLHQLETLGLDHTNVGDTDLNDLQGMKKLRVLWLSKSQVTDKGLLYLRPLKTLKQIYLHGASVTKDGISQLRKDLPDCRIHY